MFIYPWLYTAIPWLAADPKLMGLYTGSTVHELAGVVAASNAMGPDVATVAVVTKLVRVCCLEPFLLLLYYHQHRLGIGSAPASANSNNLKQDDDDKEAGSDSRQPLVGAIAGGQSSAAKPATAVRGRGVPWFALGFAGVALLNSAVELGPRVLGACGMASSACLAAAMAALGYDADLAKVKALGPKPVLVAAALWLNLLVGGGIVAKCLATWL